MSTSTQTGRIASAEQLRSRFAKAGIEPGTAVISYCGSGVTACHNLLALERAGLGSGRLFPGSWSQWSRDPEPPGGNRHRRLVSTDVGAIRTLCERVLTTSWREGVRSDGVRFGYTSPSPGHYPWQWYWDSCFAAIAWRNFDPARSRRELESLLAAATPDGFIGHTIFWNTPLRGTRRFTYNVTSGRRDDDVQHPAAAAGLGLESRRR